MSKKCLKCGCIISDGPSDYCSNCSSVLNERILDTNIVNPNAEKFASKFATLILGFGIISFFILSFYALFRGREVDVTMLLLSFVILVSSILNWAFIRIIVNISSNLFSINSILREKNKH